MIVREEGGFTLIEVITIIVVMGILAGFSLTFLTHSATMYAIGSRQRIIYQDASYIMERITRELRDAQTISTGAESLTITKIHALGGMDTEKTVMFSRDSSGNILRTSGGTNRLMGKNATSFVATPSPQCSTYSPYCTTITLQLMDPNIPASDAASRSVTLTTTVSPRNVSPSTDPYSGRSFNGDYEDTIQ